MTLLVQEMRGGVVDNTHYGHLAVVDHTGRMMYACGDPLFKVFGRSALKPMQVLPVIETGTADDFAFTEKEIALCASSHSGKPAHREGVLDILQKVGRGQQDLVCGPTPPLNPSDQDAIILHEGQTNRLCNCCSGVHAGMIATAMHCGEPVMGYEDILHPVQHRVLKAVSAVTHYPLTQMKIAIDGCGIPTFAMPLAYMAWGFARLCVPSLFDVERASALDRVMTAMIHHPDMVTEAHSFNTYLIEGFAGRVLAKEGAKGLYCLCDRERQIGVALKIEDGDKEAIPPIIHELLRQLALGTDKELEPIARYDHQDISNTCGDVVGYMNPVFSLVPQTTQL